MSRLFKSALILGRFQTFHSGHEALIRRATGLAETVVVMVGSSQESGTAKNPFPYELRRQMLQDVFGDAIKVFPIPDVGVGNVCLWVKYVLQTYFEAVGCYPDLMVSGIEDRRRLWLDTLAAQGVATLFVPKTVEISAREMRGFLLNGDFEMWQRNTPAALRNRFDELRELYIKAKDNPYTESV